MRRQVALAAAACLLLQRAAATAPSPSGSGSASCVQGAHPIEYHADDAPNLVLFIFFSVTVGAFIKIVQTYFFEPLQKIPYTVLLFLVGFLLEWLSRSGGEDGGHLGHATRSVIKMDPHLVLHVFLPPLLFESAFNMENYVLKKCIPQALLLAGPGVLIAAGLTGVLVKYWFDSYHWGWSLSFMFGAMVSATDPVAVVALLSELGAPKALSTTIEAESLLNDGSAFVVFLIFKEFAAFGSDALSVGDVFADSFRLALGGPALGLAFGIGVTQLILRFATNDPVVEIPMTIATAYMCFWTAEVTDYESSGVLAVVALGIYLGSPWGAKHLSPEIHESMEHVWHFLGHIANTVLFVLSGAVTLNLLHKGDIDGRDWWNLLLLYVTVHITRGVTLTALWPVVSRIGYPMKKKRGIIVWFGGLRGAVGLVLALIVAHESCIPSVDRDRIQFLTAGLVAMTIIVNGMLAGPLYKGLGLGKLPSGHLTTLKLSVDLMESHAEGFLDKLAQKPWWDANLEGTMYRELELVRMGRRGLAGITTRQTGGHMRSDFNEKLRDLIVVWFHKQHRSRQLVQVRHVQADFHSTVKQLTCNTFVALVTHQLKTPETGGKGGRSSSGRDDFNHDVKHYWYRFHLNITVHRHFLETVRQGAQEESAPDVDEAEGVVSLRRQDSLHIVQGRESERIRICRRLYQQKDLSKECGDHEQYSKLATEPTTVCIVKETELRYDAPYEEEELYHRGEERMEDHGDKLREIPWYPNFRQVARQIEPWRCFQKTGVHADGFHATDVHYVPLVEEIREDVRRIILQGVKAHYRKWHEERIIDSSVFGSLMEAVLYVEDEDRSSHGGIRRYDLEEEWNRLKLQACITPLPVEYHVISRAPPTTELKMDTGEQPSVQQQETSQMKSPLLQPRSHAQGRLSSDEVRIGMIVQLRHPDTDVKCVALVVDVSEDADEGEGWVKVRWEAKGGVVAVEVGQELMVTEAHWDSKGDACLVQQCTLTNLKDFTCDGTVVASVRPGSAAEDAGLRRGQRFLLVEGTQVSSAADVLSREPPMTCFLTKRPREALSWGIAKQTVGTIDADGKHCTKTTLSAVPRLSQSLALRVRQGCVAEGRRTVTFVENRGPKQCGRWLTICDHEVVGCDLKLPEAGAAGGDDETASESSNVGDVRRKLVTLEEFSDEDIHNPPPCASFFHVDSSHLLWGAMPPSEKENWQRGHVREDGVVYTTVNESGMVDRKDPRLVEVVLNVPSFENALFIARQRMWGRLQVTAKAVKKNDIETSLGVTFHRASVRVASVQSGGAADDAGIRVGMVLSQINKHFFNASTGRELQSRCKQFFSYIPEGNNIEAAFTVMGTETSDGVELEEGGQILANTQVDAFTWYAKEQRDRDVDDPRPLKGAKGDRAVWSGTLYLFSTHWRRYPHGLQARSVSKEVDTISARLYHKYSVFQSVLHPDYFLVGHSGRVVAEHAPAAAEDWPLFMERASFKIVAKAGNYVSQRGTVWPILEKLVGCCGATFKKRMRNWWHLSDLNHVVNCLLFYRAAHEEVWHKITEQWGELMENATVSQFSNTPAGWAVVSPKDNYGRIGYIQTKDFRVERDTRMRPIAQAIVNTHIFAKADRSSDRLDNIHSAKRGVTTVRGQKLVLVGDEFQLLQDPGGLGFSYERDVLEKAYGQGEEVLRSFNLFGDANGVYRLLSHRLLNTLLREIMEKCSHNGLLTTADQNMIGKAIQKSGRRQSVQKHIVVNIAGACGCPCAPTQVQGDTEHTDQYTFPPVIIPNYGVPKWRSLEKLQHQQHHDTLIKREAMREIQFISRLQAMEQRHDRELHASCVADNRGLAPAAVAIGVRDLSDDAFSPPNSESPRSADRGPRRRRGRNLADIVEVGDAVKESGKDGRVGWVLRVTPFKSGAKGRLVVRFDGGPAARTSRTHISKSARRVFLAERSGFVDGLENEVYEKESKHGARWYRFKCAAEKVQYRVAVDMTRKSLWQRRHRIFPEADIKVFLCSKELRQKQLIGELSADDAMAAKEGAESSVVHYQGFGTWWGAPKRHHVDVMEEVLFLEFCDNTDLAAKPLYANYTVMLPPQGSSQEESKRRNLLPGGLPGVWQPWQFLSGHQGSFEVITVTSKDGRVRRLTQTPLCLVHEGEARVSRRHELQRGTIRREQYLSSEHYYQTQKWKVTSELNHRDMLLAATSTAEAIMLGRLREDLASDVLDMQLLRDPLREVGEQIMQQPQRVAEGPTRYRAHGFQGAQGWELGSVGVMLEALRSKFGIKKVPTDIEDEADVDFHDTADFDEAVDRWREDPHGDRQDIINCWDRNPDGSMSELGVHVVAVDPEHPCQWIVVERIELCVACDAPGSEAYRGTYYFTTESYNGLPVLRCGAAPLTGKHRETFLFRACTDGDMSEWHINYVVGGSEDDVLAIAEVPLAGDEDIPLFDRAKELGWVPLSRSHAGRPGRAKWRVCRGSGRIGATVRPCRLDWNTLCGQKTGIPVRLRPEGSDCEFEGEVQQIDSNRVKVQWRRAEDGGPSEDAFGVGEAREAWVSREWWENGAQAHTTLRWTRGKWTTGLNCPIIVNPRASRTRANEPLVHRDLRSFDVQFCRSRAELLSTVQSFAPWPGEISEPLLYAFNRDGDWNGGRRQGGSWHRAEARRSVRIRPRRDDGFREAVRVRFESEAIADYFREVFDYEDGEVEPESQLEVDMDLQSWMEASPERIFELDLTRADGEGKPGLTLAGPVIIGFGTEHFEDGPAQRAGVETSHKMWGRNQWCRHIVTVIAGGNARGAAYDRAVETLQARNPDNTHPAVRRPAGCPGPHVGVCETEGGQPYPIWHSEVITSSAHDAVQRILDLWHLQEEEAGGAGTRVLTLQVKTEWDLELRYFPSFFDHSESVFAIDSRPGGKPASRKSSLVDQVSHVAELRDRAVKQDMRAYKYWAYYYPARNVAAPPEHGDNLYGALLGDVRSELHALLDRNALARSPAAFIGWQSDAPRMLSGSPAPGQSPRRARSGSGGRARGRQSSRSSGQQQRVTIDSTKQKDAQAAFAPIEGRYLSEDVSPLQSGTSPITMPPALARADAPAEDGGSAPF